MADSGAEYTDDIIKEMEKKVRKEYEEAYKGVSSKLDEYLEGFKSRDSAMRARLSAGEITQKEYQAFVQRQVMMGKRWEDLKNELAVDMSHANQIAASTVRGYMPEVYAVNHNYGTYQVEGLTGLDTSYTLYDRQTVERLMRDDPDMLPPPGKRTSARIAAGQDVLWNKQQIQSVMTQGVLQGKSIPELARSLEQVTEKNYNAAVRNARTMATGAQNAGREDSYKRAESMGIRMKQRWIATLDDRTRHEHRQLHGQTVDVGEPFTVDGEEIMFPGDPNADPSLVYNCRCTLVCVLAGHERQLPEDSPKMTKSFEEWQKEKAKQGAKEDEKANDRNGRSIGNIVEPERPRKRDFGWDQEDEYLAAKEKYQEEKAAYEAVLDRAIDASLNGEQLYGSREEVLKWAEERGVTVDDSFIENVDPRFRNVVMPSMDMLLERFPEVRSYEHEYYDGTRVPVNFTISGNKESALHFASADGGINFNASWLDSGQITTGMKEFYGQMACGYNVKGDGTIDTLVVHEFGHNVQEYIEAKMAADAHYFVDDWHMHFSSFQDYKQAREQYQESRREYERELMSLAGLEGSSEYSNTNVCELFAEGFAEYITAGDSTEFGRKFGEFLGRWY